MKPSTRILCTLAAILLVCAPLKAQDTLRYHLGVGVSVEPALFGETLYYSSQYGSGYITTTPVFSVSPFYIYFPLTLTRHFRLEPRFGIYSFTNEISNSQGLSQPSKNDLTFTNIGLSVEYLIPTGEKFQLYVGPRASLNFITQTYTNYGYNGEAITVTQSEKDFMISGIFGAEYFPLSELSIGGEVDFNYVSFGNSDISQSPPQPVTQTPSTRTQTLVSTGALLFVRWYFL
jgi:hypothetical protein